MADSRINLKLSRAVRNGDKARVKELLDCGADPNEGHLLAIAANNGQKDIVTLLLDKGADIEKGDPLEFAAKNGHKDIVTLLLDRGADIKEGNSFRLAARNGHRDIVTLLLARGAGIEKLPVNDRRLPVIEQQDQIRQQQQQQQQEEFTLGIKDNIENPCNINITVVGHKGVGKSCFVKQIKQENIPKGGPGSTDTADFYVNYIAYNPTTGFRQKLDEHGEMETGRHRLKRIIDRYGKGEKSSGTEHVDEPDHFTEGKTIPSSMAASASSAPSTELSEVKKTGIRQRLKRFLLQLSSRKRLKELFSKRRQIADGTFKPKLSSEQIKVIDEVMHTETKEGDEEVKGFVTIYDFGGEKVFYNTHHCFMSSNMVFVVVFDVAMCLDSSRSMAGYEITEYWLKNIATYAIDDGADGNRTPPIILVGSHLDKVSSDAEEQRESFAEVLEKLFDDPQLREIMENHLQDAYPIANLNDSTINQDVYESVWRKVIEIAPFQSQWEKPVPARWVALEHELVRLKNKGGIILTYDELLCLNRALPVPLEEQEIMDFLKNLKFTGSFHCFDLHGKSPFLVLQPQWTIDAFKAIITDPKFKTNLPILLRQKWTQYEKSGVLPMEFLTQLWREERFFNNKEALCIVMETLSLLAKPIPDNSNVEVDYFIVPSILQPADPEIIHQILKDPNTVTTVTLCLKFNNPFIPQAVWDKMIASCIHRFQRLSEPGHDGLKFIQRGFACLVVDYLWNVVINCRDNAMKITMFKKDKDKTKPTGAGVNVLCILEFLLRRILEQNHQNHLEYQFYLHNDYRFTSNEKMVKVDDLMKTTSLQCFGSNDFAWVDREDIYIWFKGQGQEKERITKLNYKLTSDLPDKNLTFKETGRVSKYIGSAYQTFFVGLDCPIEVLEQEMEEHRHLKFRTRITKVFHQLLKMKADIKFTTVAEAMSRHGMDPTKLTNILDCNRETIYKDSRLPEGRLQKAMSTNAVPVIVEYVDIKAYFNLFLELGLQPKTIDEFDDQYRNKPTRDKVKALLKAFITETKPRPTFNAILLAMKECDMDTDSLITALYLT